MLLIVPKMILRPMLCTLSSLLCGFSGSIPCCGDRPKDWSFSPCVDPFQDVGVGPQVVLASSFIMTSFLVALASTVSMCGCHVKCVSMVTPRNVAISICGIL